MGSERDKGPHSEFARYAYGYSNQKPGRAYWVIVAIMVIGAIASFFQALGK